MFSRFKNWVSRKIGNQKLAKDIQELEEALAEEFVKNDTLQRHMIIYRQYSENNLTDVYKLLSAMLLREENNEAILSKDLLQAASKTPNVELKVSDDKEFVVVKFSSEKFDLEEENVNR